MTFLFMIGQTKMFKANFTSNKIINERKVQKMLSQYFPPEVMNNLQCRKRRSAYKTRSKMSLLPNMDRDSLSKTKPSFTCFSKNHQTNIEIFATGVPLYTPDQYLSLKNVNFVIFTNLAKNESRLVAFGETDICHNDHFKYQLTSSTAGINIFRAEAIEPETNLRFLEVYLGFPQVYQSNIRRMLFQNFRVVGPLSFKRLKWTALWDKQNRRFDFLRSSKGTSRLYLPAFGASFFDQERKIVLRSPEILLGSRRLFFFMYFEVEDISFMEFIRTSLDQRFGSIADLMVKLGIPESLQLEKVS